MTTSRLQLAIRSASLGVVLIGAVVVGGCGGPAADALGPGSRSIGIAVAHAYAGTHANACTVANGGAIAGPATDRIVHVVHPRISLSYPPGWSTKPATEPWTTTGQPVFSDPIADILHDPVLGDHLFVGVASQPLAGKTGDQWAADFQRPRVRSD